MSCIRLTSYVTWFTVCTEFTDVKVLENKYWSSQSWIYNYDFIWPTMQTVNPNKLWIEYSFAVNQGFKEIYLTDKEFLWVHLWDDTPPHEAVAMLLCCAHYNHLTCLLTTIVCLFVCLFVCGVMWSLAYELRWSTLSHSCCEPRAWNVDPNDRYYDRQTYYHWSRIWEWIIYWVYVTKFV